MNGKPEINNVAKDKTVSSDPQTGHLKWTQRARERKKNEFAFDIFGWKFACAHSITAYSILRRSCCPTIKTNTIYSIVYRQSWYTPAAHVPFFRYLYSYYSLKLLISKRYANFFNAALFFRIVALFFTRFFLYECIDISTLFDLWFKFIDLRVYIQTRKTQKQLTLSYTHNNFIVVHSR